MLECQDEIRALRRATLEKSEQELQNEARRILVASMQRIASKPNNDLTATIIQLPSEEMKGRIIGREGRNIKSFESATGVTPWSFFLSLEVRDAQESSFSLDEILLFCRAGMG